MYKQCKKDALSYIIMFAAFVTVDFLKVNVLYVIAGSAIVGFAYSAIKAGVRKNGIS